MANERREALLVANRLSQLSENPLPGDFDRAHLQAVHSYIFQDIPDNNPGKTRENTGVYYKSRHLEDESIVYRVDYASHSVAKRIDVTLNELGGPSGFAGLDVNGAAQRIARLYGDLDYAHGFHDGNSRTLREFTRTLALKAGYNLDWTPTSVDADRRNHLYTARDILVLERGLADPTLDRNTDVRSLAAQSLVSLRSTGLNLETIIRENLSLAKELEVSGRSLEEPARASPLDMAVERPPSNPGVLDLRERLLKRFSKQVSDRSRPSPGLRNVGRDYDDR